MVTAGMKRNIHPPWLQVCPPEDNVGKAQKGVLIPVHGALDIRRDFKLFRRLDGQTRLHVRRQLEVGHQLVGEGAQLHVERVEEVDRLGPA